MGKAILYAFIAGLLGIMAFSACDRILDRLNWPHDSLVEEAIEEMIKKETGADLDLTPSSPEP